MTGAPRCVCVAALAEEIGQRRLLRIRETYALQLLWQLGAQLHALCGGEQYPLPDAASLFPPEEAPAASAGDVRDALLERLQKGD